MARFLVGVEGVGYGEGEDGEEGGGEEVQFFFWIRCGSLGGKEGIVDRGW